MNSRRSYAIFCSMTRFEVQLYRSLFSHALGAMVWFTWIMTVRCIGVRNGFFIPKMNYCRNFSTNEYINEFVKVKNIFIVLRMIGFLEEKRRWMKSPRILPTRILRFVEVTIKYWYLRNWTYCHKKWKNFVGFNSINKLYKRSKIMTSLLNKQGNPTIGKYCLWPERR